MIPITVTYYKDVQEGNRDKSVQLINMNGIICEGNCTYNLLTILNLNNIIIYNCDNVWCLPL